MFLPRVIFRCFMALLKLEPNTVNQTCRLQRLYECLYEPESGKCFQNNVALIVRCFANTGHGTRQSPNHARTHMQAHTCERTHSVIHERTYERAPARTCMHAHAHAHAHTRTLADNALESYILQIVIAIPFIA